MSTVIQNAGELPVVFFRFSVHGKAEKRNVREMSTETETEAGADAGTVTTLVRRIPKTYAAPIKKVEGKIRNLFYGKAIQLGDRYGVPIAVLPAFKMELDKLVQEYNLHFAKLVEASETGELQTMATKQLADLQDKVDVPTTDEIRNGYGVTVDTNVNYESASVQDAMKVLSDEIRAQLQADVEASTKRQNDEQLNSVTRQIVDNVQDFLKDVQKRCGKDDPKGIQFKTMTDKIAHIVKVLPLYNVTNDPALANLIETVRTKFENMNKDILKVDPEARKKAVESANEVTKAFANMF